MILLLIILLISSQLFSQEYNFVKFDVKDGLAISQLSKLETYSDGSLIVGTYGAGINVYDGQNFHKFNTSTGFCNNNIYSLLKSSDSLLWLGTEKGLIKFENNIPSNFYFSDGLPSETIWSIAEDRSDNLWIGTNKGLAKYENGKITSIKNELVDEEVIWSLFTDSKGGLWIGLIDGIVYYDPETETFSKREEYSEIVAIHQFIEDRDGNIWVGTDNGLFKISEHGYSKIGNYENLTNELIWSMYFDSEYNLWLGTENGVTLFSNGRFTKFGADEGLTDYRIWSIAEDLEKNIWIASDEGLYKLNDISFKIYKEFDDKPLDIWSIVETGKNNYLLTSELQGLMSFKDGEFFNYRSSKYDLNGITRLFLENDNKVWLGNQNGIFSFDQNSFQSIRLRNNTLTDGITDIIKDSLGTIYFSTYSNGLLIYDGKRFINKSLESPIYSIYIDSQNQFWLATSNGIKIFNEDSIFIPTGFEWTREYSATNLIEDYNGTIWFGTYEAGLFSFNANEWDNPKFDTVSVNHGLSNQSIMGTTIDADKNLWISTNQGFNKLDLEKYHKSKNKHIISYDLNDGIPGTEALEGGIYTDSQNNIFISTIDGLVVFDPKKTKENKKPPITKITKLKILDRDFNEKNIAGNEINDSEDSCITLSHDQNNLTIQFVGISLTNPQKVKYSYKLNDGEWSKPNNEAKAYLPNLSYGSYVFQVKSSNNHGVWSKSPTFLKFDITAPIWRKLWFQILAVFFLIGAILLFYLLRLRRISKINKDLEERIEERIKFEAQLLESEKELKIAKEAAEKSDRLKSEFLAQMSHEIRTPINSILSFSGILKEELKDKVDGTLKDGFSIIESGGRRLIRTIDSILNMSQLHTGNLELNKKQIDLCEIIGELYLELKHSADDKHIDFEIVYEVEKCIVLADQYTITQLFANLIDNAIKYTRRGKVQVIIKRPEEGKGIIEIKDSGIGMSEEFQNQLFNPFMQEDQGYSRNFDGTGLGLSLVENYASLNNAKISFNSTKDVGTTFVVEVGCK